MAGDKQGRQETLRILGTMVAVAVLVLVLMVGWRYLVDSWAWHAREAGNQSGELRNYSVPGAFGDSFAPVVGLLTSLALGAAIASVLMQRKELQLQREEMERQREEMRQAREQYTAQAAALNDANALAIHANELAHSAQIADALRQIADINNQGVACFSRVSGSARKQRGRDALLVQRDRGSVVRLRTVVPRHAQNPFSSVLRPARARPCKAA